MSHAHVAATVGGVDVPVAEVDAREARLRDARARLVAAAPGHQRGDGSCAAG